MRAPSLLPGSEDTIVAIATAPGRSALATIRVSGPRSLVVADRLGVPPSAPRVATRATLRHPESGALLDDALAVRYVAPASFTGEDALELSTHGGARVPTSVLAACIAAGCRLALPGEFTRRALLAGRIDLVQAEAIADLIDARTTGMQRQAVAQLDGGLSRRIEALRAEVTGLEALVAYDIDFPGEDDGPIAPERIASAARALRSSLDALLATAPRGAILRDGAIVVIAGPPNAGKSSLFNALLGEARALVTPIAGTTRDAIEATLDRVPTPLRLVDTAGLRETSDLIERLGIEVSERYLGGAAVVLACGATDYDVRTTVEAMRSRTSGTVIAVRTKSDLEPANDVSTIAVSAEHGVGLGTLLEAIDDALSSKDPSMLQESPDEAIVVTRERHRVAIATARDELAAFIDAWSVRELPATVAAVHLHAAREALADVTGVITLDDVLDRVFGDFCIGK